MTVVVSHRGPYAFSADGQGGFVARRGAGGVVSALRPLVEASDDAVWVAAAIGDDDRAAVAAGAVQAPGIDLRLLALDPAVHRLHYDVVSNGLLWFLHHGLLDLPRRPRFDRRFHEAWEGYVEINRAFATAAAEAAVEGDAVLVQDYQLALVAGMLRELRPDLRPVHFTHIPFCGPNSIRVLPDAVGRQLLTAMGSAAAGFHTARWANAYAASARDVLGADAAPETFAAAFCPDVDALRAEADAPEVGVATAALADQIGDRALIVRIDRIEPSKNIVRGFQAYDVLLEEHPEWRERVVFAALLNPSREGLPEYLAYRQEVEAAVARVNERWATPGWEPILLDTRDDFTRSLAGLARADVLLVNPIKDGLNLVAKEGPIVSTNDAVLCLSRDAGAFDELAEAALEVHPFDLLQTSAVLHHALGMGREERAARATRLRELATARTPADWLAANLAHAH